MKTSNTLASTLALLLTAPAAWSTGYRYEGTLEDRGAAANGRYAFRLTPHDAEAGGRALATPTEFPVVDVLDGRFAVELDFDLDVDPEAVFVGVEVSDGKSGYVALGARAPLVAKGGACWNVAGNSGVGASHVLGTTDASDVRMVVNGLPRALFRVDGGVSLGAFAGAPGEDAFAAGAGVFATGNYAIALGDSNSAHGDSSFAGGRNALVRNRSAAGDDTFCVNNDSCGDEVSFVWSGEIEAMQTSGPRQFVIGANGGVSINRSPIDPNVELTIEGRTSDQFLGNVDIVLLPSANGTGGEGIAIAAGRGTAATNDATFTIAQRNNAQFVSRFVIDTDGTTRNTTGAWSTLSDARVKRDVAGIEDALATLLALHGRTFEYSAAASGMTGERRLGFVAQEVRQVLPGWVREGSDGWLLVTPTGFEALAVEALRELSQENGRLKADNAALAARLGRLEDAVSALPAR